MAHAGIYQLLYVPRRKPFGEKPLVLPVLFLCLLVSQRLTFGKRGECCIVAYGPRSHSLHPSPLLPGLFFLASMVASTSATRRNCSSHLSLRIHCVILAMSFGLFIIAWKDLSFTFLHTSALPFDHGGQAMIICFTF